MRARAIGLGLILYKCQDNLEAREPVVPLVRIDVQEGRSPQELRLLADTVQQVMLEVFAAPPRDRYQVITEHPVGHIIAEDTGLGFERTDGVTVIQIFQQGRSEEQKKAVYRELAARLEQHCGLAPTDLVVSVVTNGRDDWSFGLGRAQFLEGDL
ncbi:MAG: tautomerase family protein [Nocardioidaceae bacterium]